jgi:hypothetical protein
MLPVAGSRQLQPATRCPRVLARAIDHQAVAVHLGDAYALPSGLSLDNVDLFRTQFIHFRPLHWEMLSGRRSVNA